MCADCIKFLSDRAWLDAQKHETLDQRRPLASSGAFSHFQGENLIHEEFAWLSHQLEPRPLFSWPWLHRSWDITKKPRHMNEIMDWKYVIRITWWQYHKLFQMSIGVYLYFDPFLGSITEPESIPWDYAEGQTPLSPNICFILEPGYLRLLPGVRCLLLWGPFFSPRGTCRKQAQGREAILLVWAEYCLFFFPRFSSFSPLPFP